MTTREAPDDCLRPLYEAALCEVGVTLEWFDVHTHTGQNDPDGYTATAAGLVAQLDRGGQRRALVFSSADPAGYRAANDRVIAEAAASGGRLVALCRLDPNDEPLAEAERCLTAGARGFKLHPRAEGFALSHPEVERLLALAGEQRLPVMVHAGRGIPALGRDAVALARRHPDARIVLAHAGISDLSWIWEEARELRNLLFDTSWWSITDLLALFCLVPPGQILYGSDTPYGTAILGGVLSLRAALAVGLEPPAIAGVCGGQAARLAAAQPLLEFGPAPGAGRLRRGLAAERALAQLYGAIARSFAETDPSESLALARLACEVPAGDPDAEALAVVRELVADAERAYAERPAERPWVLFPALGAACVAGTPSVPV